MSRQRNKRMLSFFLTIAMVLTCFPGVPAMAENEKEAAVAADSLAAETRDVTFKVKEGDLLIATNPVAWKLNKDRTIADDIEEPLGKLDGTGTAAVTKAVRAAVADPDKQCINGFRDTDCDSMKLLNEERAYFDSNPELKEKVRLSSERTEPVEEYKAGDWIWHGYRKWNPGERNSAEELMAGAPLFSGNEEYTGETIVTPAQWGEDVSQVYRKYVCLEVGEDYTIWTYVAGSETDKKPDPGALRGHTDDPLPAYLSANRAGKIADELENIDFMERLAAAAGSFEMTDNQGDKDGKIAFFFEPVIPSIQGFSWVWDQVDEDPEFFEPAFVLDCLHIQLQVTIGDQYDVEEDGIWKRYYNYSENSGFAPYSTMAHELAHYIISGFQMSDKNYHDDVWINEMIAQSVMMQVIPWTKYFPDSDVDDAIKKDIDDIVDRAAVYNMLTEYAAPMNSGRNMTYPVSVLLGGYFSGRVGIDIWKRAISGNAVSDKTFSDFLYRQEGTAGHGLDWWRAAFSIGLLQNVTGDIYKDTNSEFDIDPDTGKFTDAASKEVLVTHGFVSRYTRKNLGGKYYTEALIHDAAELKDDLSIQGGGSAIVFKVGDDIAPSDGSVTEICLKGAGKDIVWAHKDAVTGEIEVDGMPVDAAEPSPADDKAVQNPDGSWTFSSSQKAALSLEVRPEKIWHLEKSGVDLKTVLSAREAVSFNRNKKTMIDSLLDPSKSKVSINGTEVKIKKVVLKNFKKAYVSGDSIFKGVISNENMEAYGKFNDKKKPAYYLVLDSASAPSELKKAVKEANKALKKNPVPVEILPVFFTKNNLKAEFDPSKPKKCKVTITLDDGSYKLKAGKKKNRDYIFTPSGNGVFIEGTNNYNGSLMTGENGTTHSVLLQSFFCPSL